MGSNLQEKMTEVGDLMRDLKVQWVANHEDGMSDDLCIYLHFWRGDDIVAAVQCPLDRDKALHAAHMGAAGFCADIVSISFESWHSQREESPITNKRWRPREMQFVAQNYPNAVKDGWVTECLTTTVHERGGAYAMMVDPFIIKDRTVEWLEGEYKIRLSSDTVGDKGQGYMFDVMQHAMTEQTIEDKLLQEAESSTFISTINSLISDQTLRQFHFDAATLSALQERELVQGVMLRADAGSERERLIQERFGEAE